MNCVIRRQHLPSAPTTLDPEAVVLSDEFGSEAVIWPALGFNCIRWTTDWQGKKLDLLHQDTNLFRTPSPTRSGNPVLFPFPNRIRNGKYRWAGHSFAVPANHGPNAIHGFACHARWRVVAEGLSNGEAWVTGEYHGFVDNPPTSEQWPADHILRLTCRLARRRLSFEAEVLNPDPLTLPWGLGYHPYFRSVWHPSLAGQPMEIRVPARKTWELEECLPTGTVSPLAPEKDLARWRPLDGLTLDDVLTDLPHSPKEGDSMLELGALRHRDGPTLRILGTEAFRHVVVYTPADRASVCIEPYTCVTDAINLRARDSSEPTGLIETLPGGVYRAEMAWEIS